MWTFSRLSVQMLHGKDRSRDIHTTDHGCYGQGYGWALIPPLIDDHLTATETRWLQAGEKKGASVIAADQRLPGVWAVCVYGNAYVVHSYFSFTGLCSPLEKRLLRVRVYPSAWILLHHSPNAPWGKKTYPLLWRYSTSKITALMLLGLFFILNHSELGRESLSLNSSSLIN